jgi:uncharacterized membrane protein YebE (DUF533 family)
MAAAYSCFTSFLLDWLLAATKIDGDRIDETDRHQIQKIFGINQ